MNFTSLLLTIVLLFNQNDHKGKNIFRAPAAIMESSLDCIESIEKLFSDKEKKRLLSLLKYLDDEVSAKFLNEFPQSTGHVNLESKLIAKLYQSYLIKKAPAKIQELIGNALLTPNSLKQAHDVDPYEAADLVDFINKAQAEVKLYDQISGKRELYDIPFAYHFDLIDSTSKLFFSKNKNVFEKNILIQLLFPLPMNYMRERRRRSWVAARQWELMTLVPSDYISEITTLLKTEKDHFSKKEIDKVLQKRISKLFSEIKVSLVKSKNLSKKEYIRWQTKTMSEDESMFLGVDGILKLISYSFLAYLYFSEEPSSQNK